MKLHLNISLRKALLAAMAAAAGFTAAPASATLMHSDTSVMVYTDFAQNDGRYVTGGHVNSLLSYIREQAGGVAITYTGGQADYILPHGMIDFSSTADGGYAAGIGVNWLATVDHNGVINPTFTSWELGSSYAVHYAGIEYRYSDQFKHKPSNDYKVTRLSKIVTDVTTSAVYSNTAKVDANNGNGLDGELLYRNGGGTMYRVNLDGSWTWLLGAYSYTAGGIMAMDETYYNATDKAFSTVFNMNATHAGTGTATNPLAFGIYSGDSGSPTWIWNEETGQYEYLNAMQSGGGTFSQARGDVAFTLDVMAMYNKTVQFGSGNSITIGAASTQGTETITDSSGVSSTPWHGTVTVDGGEDVDYIGTKTGVNTWKDLSGLLNSDTWFSYGTGYLNTGSVSLADLYSDSNLILKAASATVTQTVNVNETVDTGVGYVEFALGDNMETASYTVTGSGQLNTAGFVVDDGVDVHMQLTGVTDFAREWRKTGAGDLYIEGTGDNNNILLNLGGSGTTYLQRDGGYAAYNVLASTGAKVVIDDLGQIERDITLGNDGGTLDMNGLSMTWNNGTDGASQTDAFTIHALDECAVITNGKAGTTTELTWTQSGTQTWLGSFTDTEDGALRFIYSGGGALNWYGIATDLSHNDASGITVASGTLMLSGSITEHARGSATGTSANRLVRWNDWHYSDATADVLVQDGGTFKLGSHARLTGDVEVASGGTFIMYEGVQKQQEYVEGGSSLEDTDLYRDYFGLKGNVNVASGGSMQVTFSSGVTSTLNYAGNITGAGSLTVALGQNGKLYLSGKNTISGEKTLSSGGIIASTRAALGDTTTNKWKLASDTYLASEDFVADTDASTILSYIDSSSTGSLALTADRAGAIQQSGLFIGALEGHTVEYGSSSATLSAVDGKWLLGGGGGQLNVNFLLNNADGELVIGSQNSSGTVKLTNTNNKIGSITIGGIGNQLIFDDVNALGGGLVTVAYGNELNIGQGVGGMLKVVNYDTSKGVLAIDTAEGAESVSTDLSMDNFHSTVLGAAGEVTYTGTLTANSSGVYAFGGRGSLTLDTNISGGSSITMDAQGLSGGSVTFAQVNDFTGSVTVGGGSGTGDISLRFGVNNALSHASSVVLQAGGKIVLDGVADAPIVRNLSSTGGSIVNETSTRQTLVLDYTQAGTTSNGLLGSNINVVKTGSGTLSLGTQSSFNGTLTIEEGTVSAGQNSLASSGVYYIGDGGVLDLSLTKCTTKNLSAANVSQVINGTGTLRMHSGGTILGSSASGSSFTGTIELTGNTRIMVGSGFDIGTGTKQSTLAALNGATIRVASGSQALVSNQFAGNSSTTHITTSACFEIGGGSYSGYRSNTINLDVAGTGGALRIDNGSTVTGTVKLLEDATISSLNYVNSTYAPTSYGNTSCLGGTILGVISGDGKNLTLSGTQRLSFRADAANSFNDLKITNNNGVEGCAFRLEQGAAASTTSTAMGLGTVSTSGSQAIQFYNAGTDDNSIVYTYANNMSLASGAKLESDYNATRLTGTVSTAGTLNLATRVNGSYVSRLMLENGISGGTSSIVNISSGSYVGLGGNNTFSGTINTGTGATLSLLSTGAVNSGVTLSYTDSLTLNLAAEGAYSLAALTSASETTALTLNFDYESAGRTTSTLTLSSALVAQTASVNLTLNEANQLKKGTYQLIAGDVSGTDFTLASSDLNGRITLDDRGADGLYMVVEADSAYYWRGTASSDWDGANWYTDSAEGLVAFTADSDVIFDADSSADSELNSAATVGNMVVKEKAISLSGSGSLTGSASGVLTVMQGGELTFNGLNAAFSAGARVLDGSQLKLTNSSTFTGDVAVTGTGEATISGGATLAGKLTLSEGGSARVEDGSVNGTANVGDGTLTVANTSSTDMAVSLQGGATLAVEGTNSTGKLTLSGTNTISGEAGSTLTVASMDNPKGTTTTIDGTTLAVTTGVLKSSGNARALNGSSTTNVAFANGGVLDDRNSYYGLTGTLNVNGAGVMHIDGIRLSNENGAGTLNVNSDSTLVVHGTTSTVSSNTSALTAAGSFMLSHWAASNANAVNILGTLTINSWVTNWDGEATINVKNGGTFNMLGGMSWGTNYRWKTVGLNVEDGARLNAAGGAQSGYLNVKFKAGSTLGIGLKEGTTATLTNNLTLGTASTTGSVTVDTTVQRFDSTSLLQTVSTEAGTMVLNGTLTDAGTTTLNVIGSGTLKLGATATLNGGITAEGSATLALGTASLSAADTTQSFGISGPLSLAVSDSISLSGTEDSSLQLNNSTVALKGADLTLSYVDLNGSDLRAEGTSALHLQTEDQTVGAISVTAGGELTLDGNMVTATKASLGANSALKLSGGATLKLGTPDLAIGVGDNTGTISTTTALDSFSLASSDLSISSVNMALYSGSHEINAALSDTSLMLTGGSSAVLKGTQALSSLTISAGSSVTVDSAAELTLSGSILSAGTLTLNATSYKMTTTGSSAPATVYADGEDYYNGFVQGWYFVETVGNATTKLADGATLSLNGGEAVALTVRSDGSILVGNSGTDKNYYINTAVTYGTNSCNQDNADLSAIKLAGGTLTVNSSAVPTKTGLITGNGGLTLGEGSTISDTVLASDSTIVLNGTGTLSHATDNAKKALSTGISFGGSWTGTISLTNTGSSRWENVDLNTYGTSISTVELKGVNAWLNTTATTTALNTDWSWADGTDKTVHTYTPNIRLTNPDSSTAAFKLVDGSSKNVYKLAGAVSGKGTFEAAATTPNNIGVQFSGDVSGWDGAFVQNTNSRQGYVVFSDSARTVNADVTAKVGTLYTMVRNAADVTFNGDITQEGSAVNNLQLALGGTKTFNGAVSVKNVSISGGAAVFNKATTVSGTFTTDAAVSIGSAGSLTLSGKDSTTAIGTLTNNGSLSSAGTLTVDTYTGTGNVSNSGTMTLGGSVTGTLTNTGTLTLNGTLTGGGSTSGALTLLGNGTTFHSGDTLTFAQGSSLTLGSGELSYGEYSVGSISGSIIGAENRVSIANLAADRVATYYAETGLIKVTDAIYSLVWNGTTANHVWDKTESDWLMGSEEKPFTDGSSVTFTGNGNSTVTLAASVEVEKLSLTGAYSLEVAEGEKSLSVVTVENLGGSFTKTGSGTLQMAAATANDLRMSLSAGTLQLDTLSASSANLGRITATGGTLKLGVTSGETAEVKLGTFEKAATIEITSGSVTTPVTNDEFAGVKLNAGTALELKGYGQAVQMGATALNSSSALTMKDMQATTALSGNGTIRFDNASLTTTDALNSTLSVSGKGTLTADSVTGGSYTIGKDTTLAAANGLNGATVTMKDGSALSTSGTVSTLTVDSGASIALNGAGSGMTLSNDLTVDGLTTTGTVTVNANITIGSTIMNSGTLALNGSRINATTSGAFIIDATNPAYDTSFSEGSNGYINQGCVFVAMGGELSLGSGTGVYFNNATYARTPSIARGGITVYLYSGRSYGAYYVNSGETTYDASLQYDATAQTGATSLALRGGTLNLTTALTNGTTIDSMETKTSTVNIASGVTLDTADLNVQQGSVALKLNGTAAVTDGGVTYTAKDETTSLTATAEGLSATNAILTAGSGATGDIEINSKLTNADLVNSSTYTLSETNAESNAFSTVHAEAGDIVMLNKAAEVSVSDLTIGAGHAVSVSSAAGFSEAKEGSIAINGGSLTAGSGSRLNADIIVSNATVNLAQGGLAMGSTLTLSSGNTYANYDAAVAALSAGVSSYTLFTGVDELVIGGSTYSSPVDASSVFSNIASGMYDIVYSGADDGTVALAYATPEPATATLSLLALAALAARRRRK